MSKKISSSSAAAPSVADRPYDVIVWGATGFTGTLVAQYLAGLTGRPRSGASPLRWALGGRSSSKLESLRSSFTCVPSVASVPDIIVADAGDASSLAAMTRQTRVVLTTVGPYQLYGESLLSACVATGTDYADITGETVWARSMIDKYDSAARASGAIIVSMCGFDSMPADIGAYVAARCLKTSHRTSVRHMHGYTTCVGGGVSGGTIATALLGFTSPLKLADKNDNMRNPYLLNQRDTTQTIPRPFRASEFDQLVPVFDRTVKKWTIPFVMASINTRVVRRSLSLRASFDEYATQSSKHSFGPDASYNECMPVSNIFSALGLYLGLVLTVVLLAFGPTRYLLQKFVLPIPSEGPSKAQRDATTFEHKVVAKGEDGTIVEAIVSGGDPGYGDTAKMISEMCLTLAHDRSRIELESILPATCSFRASGRVGGFFTPSTAGADLLVDRLNNAGVKVEVKLFGQ